MHLRLPALALPVAGVVVAVELHKALLVALLLEAAVLVAEVMQTVLPELQTQVAVAVAQETLVEILEETEVQE